MFPLLLLTKQKQPPLLLPNKELPLKSELHRLNRYICCNELADSAIDAVGSAAGITSGLATIGATVGGGATGVIVTVAAPAVTAAVVGYGAYQFYKVTMLLGYALK